MNIYLLVINNILLQEAEEAAAAKAAKQEERANAAAQAAQDAADAAEAALHPEMAKSPTYSCISYELFVGGEKGNDDNNKEKMSIRSVAVESESVSVIQRQPAPTAHATKVRKVSTVSTTQLANVLSSFFFFIFLSPSTITLNLRSVFMIYLF